MKIKRFSQTTNIVLLGPPGSGKGTIGNLLKEDGYNLISTGDLLRAEKKSGSDLGKKIAKLIDAGNLVPDDMADTIVEKEIKKLKEPFLLDGYPRTIGQAKNLDKLLDNIKVIWLEISEKTTIKRNLKRGETSKRPDDMNVDVIKQRLENYKKESYPLKEFYEKSDRLIEIDGEKEVKDVFKSVKSKLS